MSDDQTKSVGWQINKTDGEKHQVRIKKLNAVRRNEVFDEKYEETREEREARNIVAIEKRELLTKLEIELNQKRETGEFVDVQTYNKWKKWYANE